MKIMLIDDRTIRQTRFTEETRIDLNKFNDILDNYSAKKYDELLLEFRNNNYTRLNNYDVIITHRSAFDNINSTVLDELKKVCADEKKSLVFFSGGISSTTYLKAPFEFLLINSKTFYSENIEQYISEPKNILQLAYGKKYNIAIMLNILEKINLFIGSNQNNEEISFRKFKRETGIESINHLITYDPPSSNIFKISDLQMLTKNLTNQIKQQVVLDV